VSSPSGGAGADDEEVMWTALETLVQGACYAIRFEIYGAIY
jgi:hypothetical protein